MQYWRQQGWRTMEGSCLPWAIRAIAKVTQMPEKDECARLEKTITAALSVWHSHALNSLQNQEIDTVCFLVFQQRVQRPLLCFTGPVSNQLGYWMESAEEGGDMILYLYGTLPHDLVLWGYNNYMCLLALSQVVVRNPSHAEMGCLAEMLLEDERIGYRNIKKEVEVVPVNFLHRILQL